jgi:hypothetical protein
LKALAGILFYPEAESETNKVSLPMINELKPAWFRLGFATTLGIATTFAGATIFAGTTVITAFATTLSFATVFALAVVLASIACWRIAAG